MARDLLSGRAAFNTSATQKGSGNMKVKELMSVDAKSCREDTDLATATKIMWDADCGIVPVVNDDRRVIGVITDRDICVAAATRSMNPAAIRARDVMSRTVATVTENEDVRVALATIKDRRVRRLPVVDKQQRLVGVISLNDLVTRAECRRDAEIPGEEFLDAMKAICAHRATVA
jgi:CBS domain-containing protein